MKTDWSWRLSLDGGATFTPYKYPKLEQIVRETQCFDPDESDYIAPIAIFCLDKPVQNRLDDYFYPKNLEPPYIEPPTKAQKDELIELLNYTIDRWINRHNICTPMRSFADVQKCLEVTQPKEKVET